MENINMKYFNFTFKNVLVLLTAICFQTGLRAQDNDSKLRDEFKNPPASATSRAWWHWSNCNIIVEGRDLNNRYKWKKKIGSVEDRQLIINRWN